MANHGRRRRARRGNPRGKALGFHGLRPAARSKASSGAQTNASNSAATTPSQSTPDSTS